MSVTDTYSILVCKNAYARSPRSRKNAASMYRNHAGSPRATRQHCSRLRNEHACTYPSTRWISTGDQAAVFSLLSLDHHGRPSSVSLASGTSILARIRALVGSPQATKQRVSRFRRWISTGDQAAFLSLREQASLNVSERSLDLHRRPSRAFLASGRSVTPGLPRCRCSIQSPMRTQHPGSRLPHQLPLLGVPICCYRLPTQLEHMQSAWHATTPRHLGKTAQKHCTASPPGSSSLKKKLSWPVQ